MIKRFLVLVSLVATIVPVVEAQELDANRGATVFQAECVRCHIPIEINARLQNDWVGRSAQELYDRVRLTMPAENPGSLNAQQYLDLTAFLLETARIDLPDNATSAILASIQIDPPPLVMTSGETVNWTHLGGDEASTRYSPLDQINADNVESLEVAWIFDIGPFGPISETNSVTTPLMVDGTMYATAGVTRNVVALDPASGQLLWMWRPQEGERFNVAPRKGSGKGLSYYRNGAQETIFTVTPGFFLVALNARTGLPRENFGAGGFIDLKNGLRLAIDRDVIDIGISFPPLVVEDVIIVGAAHTVGARPETASNVKGDIRGFDANTGELLWTFKSIPEAGEPGFESWITGAEITGNAGAWAPLSADPELDLVYIPVEAPTGDYYGGDRHGNNLFSSSTVAVNYRTGEMVWHFQTTHHDIWDFDTPAAPIVADLPDGTPIVIQALKQGHLFAFNRSNGEPIFPVEERRVPLTDVPGEWTSAVQPFPLKPAPYERQGFQADDLVDFTPEIAAMARDLASNYRFSTLFTPPSVYQDPNDGTLGTLHLPHATGGSNWEGAAYDPETGLIYIPTITQVHVKALQNLPDVSTIQYVYYEGVGSPTIDGIPLVKPPYGRITAIDMTSGDHVWMQANGDTPDEIKNHPLLEGIEIPATGKATHSTLLLTKTLLFQGEGQGGGSGLWVRDKATGEAIMHIELPGTVSGMPMTFMLDGIQYIVAGLSDSNSTAKLVALRLPD
ncbi:MAG: quinoprotein glucose dehydrogenase [SAR86 cluster bacterium]|uniref:Quinoprotein glucose dehydrogenase n=1 Tax=SAR86 cluster bacterium TaxID=2030880 RepID=A0A2A5CDL4_9GAMM|nr:MAG: quinoprotein glucose dehydrogenase [SAR86 cluster bacterium]